MKYQLFLSTIFLFLQSVDFYYDFNYNVDCHYVSIYQSCGLSETSLMIRPVSDRPRSWSWSFGLGLSLGLILMLLLPTLYVPIRSCVTR